MKNKRILKYGGLVATLVVIALVLWDDVRTNSLSWQLLLVLIIAAVWLYGWQPGVIQDDSAGDPEYSPQHGSLAERLRRVATTRWIRFGVVSAIFFGWMYWLGNPWVLPAWFLLADIYLTQFIPWTWWRGVNNVVVRTVMSWVDAIVYALVLVYFLFLFVGQNYQIPSSSLEKTLLTGDFLWVNKMVYGPRVPQTPLHFPLVQNTLPIFNCKSYIESPRLAYHRLKGLRSVERGDIVVFNVPSGDTVVTKISNPDYYQMRYDIGMQQYQGRAATVEQINRAGHDYIVAHPEQFGELITRPVDRRENYVKRCVALPGETLQVVDGHIVINGEEQPEPQHVQYMYYIETADRLPVTMLDELGIALDDRHEVEGGYFMPLTATMVDALRALPVVKRVERTVDMESDALITYPLGYDYGWTHNNYGPVVVPKRGMTIALDDRSLPVYERCITAYEGNTLARGADGAILINGEPATSYTFKMDYYWMMGDNRDNSLDSRYWGFVPEDHVVGTPMVVLVSFDKDRPISDGGFRWNRVWTTPNPDKK